MWAGGADGIMLRMDEAAAASGASQGVDSPHLATLMVFLQSSVIGYPLVQAGLWATRLAAALASARCNLWAERQARRVRRLLRPPRPDDGLGHTGAACDPEGVRAGHGRAGLSLRPGPLDEADSDVDRGALAAWRPAAAAAAAAAPPTVAQALSPTARPPALPCPWCRQPLIEHEAGDGQGLETGEADCHYGFPGLGTKPRLDLPPPALTTGSAWAASTWGVRTRLDGGARASGSSPPSQAASVAAGDSGRLHPRLVPGPALKPGLPGSPGSAAAAPAAWRWGFSLGGKAAKSAGGHVYPLPSPSSPTQPSPLAATLQRAARPDLPFEAHRTVSGSEGGQLVSSAAWDDKALWASRPRLPDSGGAAGGGPGFSQRGEALRGRFEACIKHSPLKDATIVPLHKAVHVVSGL